MFAVLLGIWLLLTMPFSLQECAVGAAVILLVLFLFRKTLSPLCDESISIKTVVFSVHIYSLTDILRRAAVFRAGWSSPPHCCLSYLRMFPCRSIISF